MLGTRIGRGQQQEDKVDRVPVDRLIVDRLAKPRKQSVNLPEAIDLGVRNGYAVAEAGGAELLALIERRIDRRCISADSLGGEVGELLQERALVAARQGRLDRVAIEEIGKLHRTNDS